jgi:hypothetical protein
MKPARRMQTDQIAPLGGRPYPVTMTMYPLDTPGQWTRVQTPTAVQRQRAGLAAHAVEPAESEAVDARRARLAELWRRPQRTILSLLASPSYSPC